VHENDSHFDLNYYLGPAESFGMTVPIVFSACQFQSKVAEEWS